MNGAPTAGNYWASKGGSGVEIQDPKTGRMVSTSSPAGQALMKGFQSKAQTQATNWAKAQNAAEEAQINLQETEDRMDENRSRNTALTNLAFGQGTAGSAGATIGRGLYQRRRAGTRIGAALGARSQANASALGDARRTALRASQSADITRTNPVLGYAAAMNRALA